MRVLGAQSLRVISELYLTELGLENAERAVLLRTFLACVTG